MAHQKSNRGDEYYQLNLHATGFGGNSGASYVINFSEKYMPTDNHGTWSAVINVIGQGRIPNFRAKIVAHYTINGNGRLVIDFIRVANNCD